MEIVIFGQTPSKKNSKEIRQNRATGQRFIGSSQISLDWAEAALIQLRQCKYRFRTRIQIDYMFYVKDDAQRDLDNMMTSVNDVLQAANRAYTLQRGEMKPAKGTGILMGDHWQVLRIGSADAAIDRKNPRAVMTITEI
jgi:hypothetical protein